MQVQNLLDESFEETLAGIDIAIVDVFADWCGPCKRFAPIFEDASGRYSDFQFFKIDAEAAPKFRKSVEVPALPFVLAFKRGELLSSSSITTLAALNEFLDGLKS